MLLQNRNFRENLKFDAEICHEGMYIVFLNYVL